MDYKMINRVIVLLVFLLSGPLMKGTAQQTGVVVKGTITDEWNRPVPDASVSSSNGKNGVFSNNAGVYLLAVNDNSRSFVVSKAGYKSQTFEVDVSRELNIQLQPDVHNEYETVQLGYAQQLRKDVSGAVASVSGEVLERAPVANFTQTLAGRLPGLTTMETYSELSRATTNIYARGFNSIRKNGPLVVIDGIPVSYNASQSLEYISPNEIESVSLLKDASTQAIYGIQGANGVLVIKTKRGVKGTLQIHTTFDQAVQQVTTKPAFISAAEYATLRNQAAQNDGKKLPFTDAQIEKYRTGADPVYYPNTDWYNYFVKDFANMQRGSVNLTGGNDRVQFYSNVNVMHQGGYFNTDQPKYDPNANNVWVNYRTNVDMVINKYIKTFVRLAGNVKRERTAGSGNSTIYSSIFQLPANFYGPLTPELKNTAGTVTTPGEQVVASTNISSPTYGMLNRSGYYRHTVTNVTSQFGVDVDLGFLTRGLSIDGLFAYQTNAVGSMSTTQDYERYTRSANLDTMAFSKLGTNANSPLVYGKTHSFYYHLSYKANLKYERAFGKHSLRSFGYMFYQNLIKNDNSNTGALPYDRVSAGLELDYAYNDRYLVKFDWGYGGSEQYARNKRFTGFPAASAAWVVSNESFLEDQQWLSLLKLRASYGKAGNDQSGLSRFAYLNDIRLARGGPIGYLQWLVSENKMANPDIMAEVSTKKNVGIDLGLLNMITINADIFNERMENMVVGATGTIPAYQGFPLNEYPQLNEGIFENKGYEVSISFRKQLNPDLGFSIGGMYSYASNKVISINEAAQTEDYVYRKRTEGFSVGQLWGYLVDRSNGNGFFNTPEELAANKLAYDRVGKPRLGDLKYIDLNNDGIIDEKDQAPIGTGAIPRAMYAFNGAVNFRSFELNLLFQGTGTYTTIENGMGVYETSNDGVFGSLHRNAWTAERYQNGELITAPALSLTASSSHQGSDYYTTNRAYLRLKNAELSYVLPSRAARFIGAQHIRLLVSGQNLITWDQMRSDDYGPEGGGFSGFPVYRVYNMGVKVTF
ncbi:SusC/RagA family TonB-linked outer membrane protein [Niabella pedocola]|uniref:SusC/RagA family TonB-linked outer membrane protein n=1 Tax=Niabella pedocola TaxID=1752077 RepID=A0ABS8PXI7_9BACT|nr:SusC/RagA family TonB-linked outer membrane protein [Niabella pedocola]MCD2425063.1 SusC/RagA family TonB-linked outer membrane protein [Niabella pedocola]